MSHEAKQKAAFFRDSGWLMIANIVGGALMMGLVVLLAGLFWWAGRGDKPKRE